MVSASKRGRCSPLGRVGLRCGNTRKGEPSSPGAPRGFLRRYTMARGIWKKGRPSLRERFDAKWIPEPNTGCWLWTAYTTKQGYGAIGLSRGVSRDARLAHRIAWELYRGSIPEGMVLDHTCRVRCCVNPDHLRTVTPLVNTLENSSGVAATNAAKTHCIYGHPLSGDNLRTVLHIRKARGYKRETERICVTCNRRNSRVAKLRIKKSTCPQPKAVRP